MLAVAIAIALVAWAIYFRPVRGGSAARATIGLHVSQVKGNRPTMNVDRPQLTLTDAEYAVLSINPTDQGGVKLPAEDYSWASSDPSVADLQATYTNKAGEVVDPGPYGRVLVTPTPGSTSIVVTAKSGDTETMPVVVTFSASGEIGLSAGAATPE